jgi:hypothetical protein
MWYVSLGKKVEGEGKSFGRFIQKWVLVVTIQDLVIHVSYFFFLKVLARIYFSITG